MPYIDPDRVGIWGWSGGGSMSLNAIFKYPDLYKTAIAVAPVANQRYYDTIYQERYMGLPGDNVEGFTQGSPINFAHQLKGNLLLIHGTGDDNCHYQGTEALINELIRHNKPFTMMAYPNRSHAINEGHNTTLHLRELMTRYLKENLPPGPMAATKEKGQEFLRIHHSRAVSKSEVRRGSLWRSRDKLAEGFWTCFPCRKIGRLQRCDDIGVVIDENRHVREPISHGNRLDVRLLGHARRVGRDRERLVRRQLKRLLPNFIPDVLVYSLGIARAGREEVDHQDVNALGEEVMRLLNKRPDGVPTVLVPRRHDFDHRDNVAEQVVDGDPIGLGCVNLFVAGLTHETGLRGRFGHGDNAGRLTPLPRHWSPLKSNHIGNDSRGVLLQQRVEALAARVLRSGHLHIAAAQDWWKW